MDFCAHVTDRRLQLYHAEKSVQDFQFFSLFPVPTVMLTFYNVVLVKLNIMDFGNICHFLVSKTCLFGTFSRPNFSNKANHSKCRLFFEKKC